MIYDHGHLTIELQYAIALLGLPLLHEKERSCDRSRISLISA
jgi:hypothetical protein